MKRSGFLIVQTDRPTHQDVLTLDVTFHVAVPVDAAISEDELRALLTGTIEKTEYLPPKKAQRLCDEVDHALSAAWFTDGRKFPGADIRIAGIEEREVV